MAGAACVGVRGARSPRPDDIYIALMGLTGSGKSSFIALCCPDNSDPSNNPKPEIGDKLEACTSSVAIYLARDDLIPGCTVYLVDTPGFDDTERSDNDIDEQIKTALQGLHGNDGIRLTGIIFLSNINHTKIGESTQFALLSFHSIYSNAKLFATTHWDQLSGSDDVNKAMKREKKLKTNNESWGSTSYHRHLNTRESAKDIILAIVRTSTTASTRSGVPADLAPPLKLPNKEEHEVHVADTASSAVVPPESPRERRKAIPDPLTPPPEDAISNRLERGTRARDKLNNGKGENGNEAVTNGSPPVEADAHERQSPGLRGRLDGETLRLVKKLVRGVEHRFEDRIRDMAQQYQAREAKIHARLDEYVSSLLIGLCNTNREVEVLRARLSEYQSHNRGAESTNTQRVEQLETGQRQLQGTLATMREVMENSAEQDRLWRVDQVRTISRLRGRVARLEAQTAEQHIAQNNGLENLKAQQQLIASQVVAAANPNQKGMADAATQTTILHHPGPDEIGQDASIPILEQHPKGNNENVNESTEQASPGTDGPPALTPRGIYSPFQVSLCRPMLDPWDVFVCSGPSQLSENLTPLMQRAKGSKERTIAAASCGPGKGLGPVSWIVRYSLNSTTATSGMIWEKSNNLEQRYPRLGKQLAARGLQNLELCTLGPGQSYYARWLDGAWSCRAPGRYGAVWSFKERSFRKGHTIVAAALGPNGTYVLSYHPHRSSDDVPSRAESTTLHYEWKLGPYYGELRKFLETNHQLNTRLNILSVALNANSWEDYILIYAIPGEGQYRAKWKLTKTSTRLKVEQWWREHEKRSTTAHRV